MLWALLAFLVVATTKYLTSLRLRKLSEQIVKDRQTTEELRTVLSQVAEKESILKTQTEELVNKVTVLNNIVSTLERSVQRSENSDPTTTN